IWHQRSTTRDLLCGKCIVATGAGRKHWWDVFTRRKRKILWISPGATRKSLLLLLLTMQYRRLYRHCASLLRQSLCTRREASHWIFFSAPASMRVFFIPCRPLVGKRR